MLQESLQIKGEVNISRGEKTLQLQKSFLCDSIFSPSIIPFKKPFLKSLRKFFLTLFGPSCSLSSRGEEPHTKKSAQMPNVEEL
jgi:hypothetical protein